MQIGDGLCDAETEPVSRRLTASLTAIETVKDLCPLLRGNADARVAYERERPPVGHSGLDPDGAAGGGELDRVVDQVRKGFAHEVLVAANRDEHWGLDNHCYTLRLCA